MDSGWQTGRFVHLFFLDGVGLGNAAPDSNPYLSANLAGLTRRLGPDWFLNGREPIITPQLSLVPTDANLGMPGRPQSATGQATILTGRNVPAAIGTHYGPKPNAAVRAEIDKGTIFSAVTAAGGRAALITPYPQGYFDGLTSGKRLLSAVPYAATQAGLDLLTAADLQAGRAVSPGFTGQAWRDHLGYDDIPLLSLAEAGQQIAAIARQHQFSFFEHWPSDRAGHRGSLAAAAQHLETVAAVIDSLLDNWDYENGLLIITSDHGNIEDKSHRNHTLNPVPTILAGPGQAEYAGRIHDLTDLVPIIRDFLGLAEGLGQPDGLADPTGRSTPHPGNLP
ncbi:MAG: hypothetical protein KDE59_06385 [Anaerolineales bacterium]|nr:hypothetical protein [Anaerolineales bacterium]